MNAESTTAWRDLIQTLGELDRGRGGHALGNGGRELVAHFQAARVEAGEVRRVEDERAAAKARQEQPAQEHTLPQERDRERASVRCLAL